jgi:hypothetical protein
MSKRWAGILVVALLSLSGTAVEAQVFTPTFQSPQRGGDTGVYLNGGPGDFSLEGIWRRNLGNYDLGFRGGVAGGRDPLLLVGAEFRTPVRFPEAPVIAAITGGVQGVVGGGGGAGFQGGMTLGYPLADGQLAAVPYIHPRIGLVNRIGGGDELDLDVLLDLGVDVTLQQNFVFRFGFGLGRQTARWGMGFAWR